MAVIALVVVSGVATFGAVVRRASGTASVAASEPLIVDVQAMDTALSQADATAANTFLGGGIEPTDQHLRYQQDLADATRLLADAAERGGSGADVRSPLQTLAAQIPGYAGMVDTARANNRQGYPVGAAYLRQASRLMSGTILPAAQQLYGVYAGRLDRGSAHARSVHDTALVSFLLFVILLTLAGVQVWMYLRSHRVLNIPLAAATVLAIVLLGVVGADLKHEASQTAQARDHSFASVNLVAQSRILAFRAKGDESLTLIGRGNGGPFEADFKAQVAKIPPLLAQAQQVAVTNTEQADIQAADTELARYLSVHARIRSLDDGGQFDQAVKLATASGSASASNQAFNALDVRLTSALTNSQADFASHMSTARNNLRLLKPAVVVILLIAGLLALYGFQQRINEYR
jgi:hypothetical protein